MLLSVVVPVYREERMVPEFLRRVRPILAGITEDYEIIFALDPSPDRTGPSQPLRRSRPG